MSYFQPGDKAIIKYWEELPDEDDWNELFFDTYGGDRVTVQYQVSNTTFDVITERSNTTLTVGYTALKRDRFHIPEHLFEIE